MSGRRPLSNRESAEEFLHIFYKPNEPLGNLDAQIAQLELTIIGLETRPTLTHTDYRDKSYKTNALRKELRLDILKELASMEQLDNDDDIKKGFGGSKPKTLKAEREAYIITGSPASGKSNIATRLATENGAYIIDSDYAKRKFPEYSLYGCGASLVHDESNIVVFGAEDSLLEYCVYNSYNMVVPLVGKSLKSLDAICNRLHDSNYCVHLVNVVLDRELCVKRACERFKKTGRYVPLSYIFDEVGNEPERVYFLIKRKHYADSVIKSFSQISTDVEKGQHPLVVEKTQHSPLNNWE